MAVQNSIAAPPVEAQKATDIMKCRYKCGEEEVLLTPQFVKQFLVTGNEKYVTSGEIVMFMNLCKHQHLNPFLREAYLIKYSEGNAAQLVVGKAAFEARADRDERYEGCDCGIIVQKQDKTLEYRKGTLVLQGELLVGGWAEVFVRGYRNSVYTTVSLSEYSTGKSLWQSKPATMIRKVAKVQALREAFPNTMSGMYVADEVGYVEEELPRDTVEQPIEQPVQPVVQPQVVEVQPEELDGSGLLL